MFDIPPHKKYIFHVYKYVNMSNIYETNKQINKQLGSGANATDTRLEEFDYHWITGVELQITDITDITDSFRIAQAILYIYFII
jgi:hypothetical protein